MRLSGKLLLVLAMIALASNEGLAQRQQFPLMGGFGGGPLLLLNNKGVQEELKMTREQTEKLGGMQKEMIGKVQYIFSKLQGVKPEERREKLQEIFKEINAEAEKLAKEILKPEQMKRLKQIEMQQAGVRNFANEETVQALKLTDAQKDKIKRIVDDLEKGPQEAFKAAGRDPRKMENLRKDAEDKVNAILNAEQKKAYRDLLGEPFLKIERPNIKPN
jgi:Spy/CpxP family protein refolding chaperone